MNRFIQKNKFILVLLTIVICLSCAYGLTVKLDPTVNAASAKVSASDYSWATMSQAAAQYLGQAAAPSGSHGLDVSTPAPKTGFAGAFLGYLTPGDENSRYTVASLESANTVSYSYATLEQLHESMGSTDCLLSFFLACLQLFSSILGAKLQLFSNKSKHFMQLFANGFI